MKTITTQRMEAFSDGVIAIIITIMVLELKVPHDVSAETLRHLWPLFGAYVFSFILVAITWINHHHLLHHVVTVDARVLWANVHLLFWLSMIPFATGYVGHFPGEPLPVALYGLTLACSIGAFTVLRLTIARQHAGDETFLARHRIVLRKNLLGLFIYACSVPLAFVSVYASYAFFVLIPLQYILPQQRHAAA